MLEDDTTYNKTFFEIVSKILYITFLHHTPGVVYFMEDDNTYNEELFEIIRKIMNFTMFLCDMLWNNWWLYTGKNIVNQRHILGCFTLLGEETMCQDTI